MSFKAVRFVNNDDTDFINTLKKRVKVYFADNNLSKHGNWVMVLKTIAVLSIYFVPYFLVVFDVFPQTWVNFLLWSIMGFGMAFVGMSVMHDANHGSYSSKTWVNNTLGYLINFLGGNALNWKIQHNMLHHSFTNIDGHDEDIDAGKLLRFSPNQERYKFHKLQHIYAWFLYCLMTLSWCSTKDFRQLKRYHEMGFVKDAEYKRKMAIVVISKIAYWGYVVAIPMYFSSQAWYIILLSFLTMHAISGLSLSAIFQPAHVMETSVYPEPTEKHTVENNWAIHQMRTTTNFAPKSRLFSFFIGGLNYQIEHHLFPNICHIHYRKLSEIVKQTAEEFDVPYHSETNFVSAIWSHGKMLRHLGVTD